MRAFSSSLSFASLLRHGAVLVAFAFAVGAAACGDDDEGGGGGPGGPTGGPESTSSGGPPTVLPVGGGTQFPWPVFDGTVPDTPEATNGGKTYYVDANKGSDSADGASFATAKQTLSAALKINGLKAGDTILLAGGIYREYPDWTSSPAGKQDAPLTIGSYGRGTGAPILDGGIKPPAWTKYSEKGQTTVWQTSLAGTKVEPDKTPVLGVYVNSGKGEYALRETVHGQVRKILDDPLPPAATQQDIKDNSSDFYYDAGANVLYADFGGTLGASGDPNTADISILYNTENSGGGHKNLVYFAAGHDYMKFVGITFRASSWSAVYTTSHGHTFDHCDFKFNGGAAAFFDASDGKLGSGNTVRQSRIWMNVLHNWPRFNNGNTGGGWPAAINWSSQENGLSEGNISYLNGGEGMTVGNSDISGSASKNNVVRHNIVFDNFSVNMYANNVEGVLFEENFVFQHPRDDTQTFTGLLQVSPQYNVDFGRRLTPPNLVLGDEPGSAYDQQAHLANITVINNIVVGGKYGFLDYDDGTQGPNHHGLKNCIIANNTFVLNDKEVPGLKGYGWNHLVSPDQSANSIVKNNIFVTSSADDQFAKVAKDVGAGIDNDFNLYAGPGKWNIAGDPQDFGAWKSTHPTWDQHSVTADAMLEDVAEFNKTAAEKLVYDWTKAKPKAGSAALGAATNVDRVQNDFTGKKRGANAMGALAP